jgi:regulator of protease activity HflC (stomatin/prohibitin superfamily)
MTDRKVDREPNYVGLGILAVVALIGLLVAFKVVTSFVNRVDPGYAGVLVDYAAGTVNNQPNVKSLPTGSYQFVNPVTQVIMEYPVAQQTLVMVQEESEGQVKKDDSVQCRTSDSNPIFVDVSFLWRVDADHVAELYLLQPGRDINTISTNVVRQEARNAVVDTCSEFPFKDIFSKHEAFGDRVQDRLAHSLSASHILVDRTLVRNFHLNPEQKKALDAVLASQQNAVAASFLKQQAQYEAEAKVAQAQGSADSQRIDAAGRADAIKLLTDQLRNSPEYLQYKAYDKWDGKLPETLVEGTSGTLFTIK